MAGEEVRGGQLDVVSGLSQRDGEDVFPGVDHEMVGVEHRKRERMEPGELKQGPVGDHRDVYQVMAVSPVEQQGGLETNPNGTGLAGCIRLLQLSKIVAGRGLLVLQG